MTAPAIIYPTEFCTVAEWCRLTGATADQVEGWIRSGHWLQGREYVVKLRRRYVSRPEADRWIKTA